MLLRVVAALFVACAGGCGSASTPSAPGAQAPPTAETLTITGGVDSLRTGFFADYTVTAVMSDRTTQVVTKQAVLTSSDPSKATVDANGRLTAVTHGPVAINASFQGRAVSRTVNIVFNYGGTWTGTYTVRSCEPSGIFETSRYCQNLGNGPQRLSLELTQGGLNADQISGSILLQNFVGATSGSVTPDGRLILGGQFTAASGGSNVRVDLRSWVTAPVGATGMSGSFVFNLAVIGADGSANQANEIVTATKTLETASRTP